MKKIHRPLLYFLGFTLFAYWALPCLSTAATPHTPSARDIMMEAQNKQFPKNSIAEITMVLINKRGHQRTRQIQSKRRDTGDGEGKSVAIFLAPADVKGTAFLVWEHKDQPNDVFIYLPALKKIRRIASEQKNQSFMGSDFSYSDMENRDVDDAGHKLLGEEMVDSKSCWIIESIPKPDSDTEYGRLVSWVSKDNLIPMKVEFYDKKMKLFKRMNVIKTGPVGKEILPLHFTMEDVKKSHKTEIVINKLELDQEIPDSEFTHRAIRR